MPRDGAAVRSLDGDAQLALRDTLVLAFSRDRPMQLDALLESFRLHCQDRAVSDVKVLFRASGVRFRDLYRRVARNHEWATLVREQTFHQDLVGLIRGYRYVLFLVDDAVFVRPFSLAVCTAALEREPGCIGVSLRLGRNTTYCYPADSPQQVPDFVREDGGLVSFDWSTADFDFGYPLEVSSSIYRVIDVLRPIERSRSSNPNRLEAALARSADNFRASKPRLLSFEHSVAFCTPVNLVQDAWSNRVGADAAYGVDALANRFELGDRVAVRELAGFEPNACHQEVALPIEEAAAVLPIVSVVIPCYNQARYLSEAISSVARQTFTDWEIILVDDGSPDDTLAVAHDLQRTIGPEKLRILSTPNQGVAAARNCGVREARGIYILPLDADDRIAPSMLATSLALLRSDESVAIAYCDVRRFGAVEDVLQAGEYDFDLLCARNQLNYCALFAYEVWKSVDGYDPTMILGYEDWDFWIASGELGYWGRRIPEPLFEYRVKPWSREVQARTHDEQLRGQIAAKHPAQYTPIRRVSRTLKIIVRRVAPMPRLRWGRA